MSRALVKSTSVVSTMTFVSRILGFVRDMLVAQIFGINASVDAFNVAFKIPNFMRNLFAEGSFSQAFVPVLSSYRQTRKPEETLTFISHMAGWLCLILSLITLFGELAPAFIIKLFGPGLDPYRFQLATEMLRMTFPYLMLISLTAFSAAILNSYGLFAAPAFTPALLNVCLIITAYGVTRFFSVPIEAQAVGVLLGGFVQLGFLLPFIKKLGFLQRPRLSWHDPGVRRVLKLMLPLLFGASVAQISLLLNTIFASFLKVGSITWLYYSERLAYFPLGVFGVALLTVVLPHLSRQHAAQSKLKFSETLDWGIRCNLLIGLPASLAMCILSGPLIVTLFAYGKFSVNDVYMTQQSVIAYSLGLQSFMLVKILSGAFYARQDAKTPVKIGILTVLVSLILNALFLVPLAHAGLALASSVGSWFNTLTLGVLLYKRDIYRFKEGWGKFITRLLFSNLILAGVLWVGSDSTAHWMEWHWWQRALHIAILGSFCMAIYVGCLWISGIRLRDFKSST